MRGGEAFRASARRAHWLPPRWAERPRAYVGPWPILEDRTLAEVDESISGRAVVLPAPSSNMGDCTGAFPDWPDAPLPEELEGSHAKAGGDVAAATAVVREAEPSGSAEPVSRPAAGRSAAATSEPMDVTAGETAPEFNLPQGEDTTAESGSGREGLAPEGTSGAPVGDGQDPANAEQSHSAPEAMVVPFPGDEILPIALAPSAPAIAPAGAGEDPQEDPEADEFEAVMARLRARREASIARVHAAEPKIDFARLAEAARGRQLGSPAKKPPTTRALSADPCPRCGIPGFRGCDHQLPFEGYTPPAPSAEDRPPANRGKILTGGRTFRI